MPLFGKCRIPYLHVTLRELENVLYRYIDDFVGWVKHQTVFSVACNPDSEQLAALYGVETVVRTQIYRLDADKFSIFSVDWTLEKVLSQFGSLLV